MLRQNVGDYQSRRTGLDCLRAFCETFGPPSKTTSWMEAMRETTCCSMTAEASGLRRLRGDFLAWGKEFGAFTVCRQAVFAALLLCSSTIALSLGCAAEEKKPQTVTEWMQQPRVGETKRK